MERALANDTWQHGFSEDQLREMERAREAGVGGERGFISWATGDIFGVGETSNDLRRQAQGLADDQFAFSTYVFDSNQRLQEQIARAKAQNEAGELSNELFRIQLDGASSMQRDYGKLFGSSQQGILQGILTDQTLLDRFAANKLDDDSRNMVITAIETLSRPYTTFDNMSGQTTRVTPRLPSAVVMAGELYEKNSGTPMFNKGGLVTRRMADGGPADLSAFQKRLLSVDPSSP